MSRRDHPESTRPRLLIEEWLPIAKIGIESLRERTPMTPFPAPNRLHVWWARRPLVASRAAILASLLPADADRGKFLHMLGIHGDPVAAKVRIAQATRDGVRLGKEAYGYSRAFSYSPDSKDREWLKTERKTSEFMDNVTVLDPTAGGGSIPFEAARLGLHTIANDLNPVAWLILKATVEFPAKYGKGLLARYDQLGLEFRRRAVKQLAAFYPPEPLPDSVPDAYLWSRTITCPYCGGLVPLSPNWRLDSKGTGVRLVPHREAPEHRHCTFEIVTKAKDHSAGTVKGGDGLCPFPDCGRVIDGDEVKSQAKAGKMGEQLYTVVYKQTVKTGTTKAGKDKVKSVRGFRSPRPEDDVSVLVNAALEAKMPEWQAQNIVPDETYPELTNDERPRNYGMPLWRDMFSLRQLLGHCTSVEVYHELVDEIRERNAGDVPKLDKAALTYLAVALDKMLNYNSRKSVWMPTREVVANTFNRHDFSFCWSHSEMAPTVTGLGYEWTVEQTGKALEELIELSGRSEDDSLFRGKSCPRRGSSFVERCMRTQSYPSDLTDAQWPMIEPHLPVYPGGRPRTTDLRDVVDAIFYILRTGCQWRYLPKDFPPKSTVWRYFDEWRHNDTLETIHDLLRRKVRAAEKPYSPRTSASVDSQSVDTTSGGEQRGRDNAKDVDGRKRHIIVESMGLLMAVLVTAARIDDATAAAELFARRWKASR